LFSNAYFSNLTCAEISQRIGPMGGGEGRRYHAHDREVITEADEPSDGGSGINEGKLKAEQGSS
jgi:hypothetical protein